MINFLQKMSLFLIFFLTEAKAEYILSLETKTYDIKIKVNCEEGNVSCDDVMYTMKNKNADSEETFTGKTLNRKNNFDLYGYTFKKPPYVYIIQYSQDGADLYIEKENLIVTFEKGEIKD